MHRLFFALCAVFVFLADARAESPTTPSGTPVEQSLILDRLAENEFVPPTVVDLIHGQTGAAPDVIWLAQMQSSDAEAERFIRATIAYWIANDQYAVASVYNEATRTREKRPIKQYSSVDEFLARNPDCCRFGVRDSEGYWPGFWYRYRNNYAGLVSITRFTRTYADTSEDVISSGRAYAIDRDGQLIEEPFWAD